MMKTTLVTPVKDFFLQLQQNICDAIEQKEPHAKFIADAWQHASGGGGLTKVMAGGKVIEKGAVNFSHVKGVSLPKAATVSRKTLNNLSFEALGVSVIMHPLNPYIPTSHLNVRAIFVDQPNEAEPHWWFGGGFDLTPYYPFTEDCVYWHEVAKAACDPLGKEKYLQFKQWADDYFFLKHRAEPRGIGGIFFDDLNCHQFEDCFSFVQSVGKHYQNAYIEIINRRKEHPYGERELNFQAYRRGRYVEFNLLHDRGTLFGLQSGGRTESILVSLPPRVNWTYDYKILPDSAEEKLYQTIIPIRNWV